MRLALVTGEFPPDIGGTATHSSTLAQELVLRGHEVRVVTLWDGVGVYRGADTVRFPRRWAWPARSAAIVRWIRRHKHEFEIVYAPSLHVAAVLGASVARRPVVLNVPGDHAWERGKRLGLVDMSFADFQRSSGGSPRVRAMRWARNFSVRKADAVVVPSDHLRQAAESWLKGAPGVTVIPNGIRVPHVQSLPKADDGVLRAIFVGRLISIKRVDVLLDAITLTEGIELEVIGEGPEWQTLERRHRRSPAVERITFSGRVDHGEVLTRMAAADVLVLASEEEGLPTVALEALASGTPVIASEVGGIPEVVRHEVNGLLVASPDPKSLAGALTRISEDPVLRKRLAEGALRDSKQWRLETCVDGIEGLLRRLIEESKATAS